MKKVVKTLWLKALRSGKYRQTTRRLRSDTGFCCLGVLCDLYQRRSHRRLWTPGNRGQTFLGEEHILPRTVLFWAGLDNPDPVLGLDASETASMLNDTGVNFQRLADYIEANL